MKIEIKKRFKSDSKSHNITLISSELFEDRALAFDKEQQIIKSYKSFKYQGKKILNGGNTELFFVDINPL